MTPLIRRFASLPLFLLVLSGCNTSTTPANVHGKITYKGEAVPAGSLAFHLPEGGMFPYALLADGSYSGSDLPLGEYVVTVETESANPKGKSAKSYDQKQKAREGGDPDDYMKKMKERGQVPNESPGNAGPYVKIPAKYSDKKTSPLKANLVNGNNELNFELTD